MTSNKDQQLIGAVNSNINLAVPWFLMTSWLYYHKDINIISDVAFDRLCRIIDESWSDIKHNHKHLIRRSDMKAGTGYSIPDHKFPLRVKSAAMSLYHEVQEENGHGLQAQPYE